jgi:hypothetical protein
MAVQVPSTPLSTSITPPATPAAEAFNSTLIPIPKSPMAREFYDLMMSFREYKTIVISSIRQRSVQRVVQGIVASSYVPDVYRAFEVLYQDYPPIRLAGRKVANNLLAMLRDIESQQQAEVDSVIQLLDMPVDLVHQAHEDFVTIVATSHLFLENQDEDCQELYQEELYEESFATKNQHRVVFTSTIGEITKLFDPADMPTSSGMNLIKVLGHQEKNFMDALMEESHHRPLTFAPLVRSIHDKATESNRLLALQLLFERLQEVVSTLEPRLLRAKQELCVVTTDVTPSPVRRRNARQQAARQRHRERYNEMVAKFDTWQSLIPPKSSGGAPERRLDIVRGCFVGAQCPPIVEALRVIYTDYTALRWIGDLIYKLVATIMEKRAAAVASRKH